MAAPNIPQEIRPGSHHERTAQGFLDVLSPVSGMLAGEWDPGDHIYRGHGSAFYGLTPSAFRDWNALPSVTRPGRRTQAAQIRVEADLLRRFLELADKRGLRIPEYSQRLRGILNACCERDFPKRIAKGAAVWPPDELLSVLSLAQHYGIPTRLLDWTYHPYVAAYFAAAAALTRTSGEPLAVWAFNKGLLYVLGENTLYPWLDRVFRLVTAPAADIPNLFAQQGLFMLRRESHPPPDPNRLKGEPSLEFRPGAPFRALPYDTLVLNDIGFDMPQRIFYRFTLPRREALELLRLLAALGIDASTVYPGYQGVSHAVREQAALRRAVSWDVSRTARTARARYRPAWRRLQKG